MFGAALTHGEPGPNGSAAIGERDRRASDRFDMNPAAGTLEYMGTRMRCDVIDLSLTGCHLKTREDFRAGSLAHVKLTVPIDGMVLRIWGITQWPVEESACRPVDVPAGKERIGCGEGGACCPGRVHDCFARAFCGC